MGKFELDFIIKLVHTKSGIYLTPEKSYLIESRLRKLLKNEGLDSIEELVKQLQSSKNARLSACVVDALTTNETSFFRDGAPFDALRQEVIPDLIQTNASSKKINIWSAACSSGQEPYSIVMLLYEHFPSIRGWDINILATDLSEQILLKAQQGFYTDFELKRGLPESLKKYFTRQTKGWQIKDTVQKPVTFEQLNLIEKWPAIPSMDIVFIRNVLIYFQPDVKERILQNIADILKPNGYLFLGQSETLVQLKTPFQAANIASAPCYRKKNHILATF